VLTVSKAIQSYLAELNLAGRSDRTVCLHKWLLYTWAKGIEDHPIESITRVNVTTYLGDMAERGLSQSYIATTGKTIRRLFNWAVEQGILEVSPLEHMKIARGPDKPIAPFTDDECRRLIAAADTPLKRFCVLLLMDTGIRSSELCSLRLQDIDLANSEITVVKGKGGKGRKVALNERPRRALLEYLTSRAQQDGLLWPKTFDRVKVWKLIDKIARDAHVCCAHPHRLRHNWAVRMRRAGVDASDIQLLLGHSSLKMTMRYVAYCQQEVSVDVHKLHCIIPM